MQKAGTLCNYINTDCNGLKMTSINISFFSQRNFKVRRLISRLQMLADLKCNGTHLKPKMDPSHVYCCYHPISKSLHFWKQRRLTVGPLGMFSHSGLLVHSSGSLLYFVSLRAKYFQMGNSLDCRQGGLSFSFQYYTKPSLTRKVTLWLNPCRNAQLSAGDCSGKVGWYSENVAMNILWRSQASLNRPLLPGSLQLPLLYKNMLLLDYKAYLRPPLFCHHTSFSSLQGKHKGKIEPLY